MDSSVIQSLNEPVFASVSPGEASIIEQSTSSLDAAETPNSSEHGVDHELSTGTTYSTTSEVRLSPLKTSVCDSDYNDYGKPTSVSNFDQQENFTKDDSDTGSAEFEPYTTESGKDKGKYTFEDEYASEEDCNEDFYTFDIRAFFLKAFKASIDHATDESTTSDDYEGAISDSESTQGHVDLHHKSLDSCSSTPGPPGPHTSSVMDVGQTGDVSPYIVRKSFKRKASFIEGPSRITLDDIRRRERMQSLNSYEWQHFS